MGKGSSLTHEYRSQNVSFRREILMQALVWFVIVCAAAFLSYDIGTKFSGHKLFLIIFILTLVAAVWDMKRTLQVRAAWNKSRPLTILHITDCTRLHFITWV